MKMMRPDAGPDPRSDPHAARFVRSHLKTRHLVLLVELGRNGSIMQAAQAANLTQPAASKLLGELEHALGVPLFERCPRGVEPTWYGKVLIRRAGASLAEMDAAYQEVMGLMSGLRGRVAVGAILTPSTTIVPDAVAHIRSQHARLHISVDVDSSKRLVERLRAGALDIVVGRIVDPAVASELQFEPITGEPHCLVVRAGHPLLSAATLDLAALARQAWILPPEGSLVRDSIAALFLAQGLEQPLETVTTMETAVVTTMLNRSDMLAPMSTQLVRPYLDSGMLAALPFDLSLRMDVYGIVTRRRHSLSPAAEAMLAALREAARARYGSPC
jgi:DNA-binding transcriptional LysR family regulator